MTLIGIVTTEVTTKEFSFPIIANSHSIVKEKQFIKVWVYLYYAKEWLSVKCQFKKKEKKRKEKVYSLGKKGIFVLIYFTF